MKGIQMVSTHDKRSGAIEHELKQLIHSGINSLSTAYPQPVSTRFQHFIHRLSTGGGIWEGTPNSIPSKNTCNYFTFSVIQTYNLIRKGIAKCLK
jgi:hypothetical protein